MRMVSLRRGNAAPYRDAARCWEFAAKPVRNMKGPLAPSL